MELKDLCLIVKNAVDSEFCSKFIEVYEKRKISSSVESSLHAQSGIHQASSFRTVQIAETADLYKEVVEKMNTALDLWLQHLSAFGSFHIHALKGQLRYPHAVRILKYERGQSIHPHIDWGYFTHASVTLNLNSGYEGGEFCFFNRKFNLKLEQGDALIFPADSFWVHEVTPVTAGSRYSINSFIKSCPPTAAVDFENSINQLNSQKEPCFKFS